MTFSVESFESGDASCPLFVDVLLAVKQRRLRMWSTPL